MASPNQRESDAAVIGVYAAVVYDVISATNSSPQTTEINARARASTLMKWVNIGLAQAGFFVFLGVIAEKPGKRWRPLIGGGTAMILLWVQYLHAKAEGLRSPGTPTETNLGAGRHSTHNGMTRGRARARVNDDE